MTALALLATRLVCLLPGRRSQFTFLPRSAEARGSSLKPLIFSPQRLGFLSLLFTLLPIELLLSTH
jgi:hypothetical protein